MQLTKNQKEAVRTLLRYLGLNQSEFSKRANWAPSALSEVLNREDGKGVSPEKWVEVRQALRALVAENSARLQEEGRTEAAKILLDQLQGREEGEAQRIQFPGGTLKARALNYVQRHCDVALMSNLYRVEAPCIIVRGGVQYGKSSLLMRFAERAEELGHYVAKSDAKTFEFTSGTANRSVNKEKQMDGWSSDQLFSRIFRDIAAEFPHEGSSQTIMELARDSFEAWLQDRAKHYDRIFLMVDSLDSLIGRVTPQAFTDLLSFFAGLRSRASETLFDRLTLIVAYSGTGWSAAYASKFQSQGYELDVRPFEEVNVAQLLKLLEITAGENLVRELRTLFSGHPHLVHLAAYEISLHGEAVGLKMAKELIGAFQTHVDRIFQEVGRLADFSQIDIKDLLLNLFCHIEKGDPVAKPLQRHLPALAVMGLVGFNNEGIFVSDFYKIAIQSELNRLGVSTSK